MRGVIVSDKWEVRLGGVFFLGYFRFCVVGNYWKFKVVKRRVGFFEISIEGSDIVVRV